MSIWTNLTASPCYTTHTRERERQRQTETERDRDRQMKQSIANAMNLVKSIQDEAYLV